LFNKPDTAQYQVIIGNDTILTKLDSPPCLIGGAAGWFATVLKVLRYPPEARRYRIEGKAIIKVIIDRDGKPIKYQLEQSIGGGIDEEAIRIIKLAPYGWIPGILNGEKVKSVAIMRINFKLA
jgi:periplasmic protein TonB